MPNTPSPRVTDPATQIEIARRCTACNAPHTFILDHKKFERWRSGALLIQDALPELSAADRELLISCICGACFDRIIRNEEEAQ